MKNLFLLGIASLFSLSSFSQSLQKEIQHPDIAGRLFHNSAKQRQKTIGIPYSYPMFSAATVENLKIKAYMRYNVVNDEFEFITTKNDTLILDKIEDFGNIRFSDLKKNYILTAYVDSRQKLVYGYLIDIYKNKDFGLLKKENITFVEEKIAKTTLEINMPPKYNKVGDSFFIKNKEAISAFPDGKKALTKMFPDKKQLLETFLKENKISFDAEKDLIKLIDFIAAN